MRDEDEHEGPREVVQQWLFMRGFYLHTMVDGASPHVFLRPLRLFERPVSECVDLRVAVLVRSNDVVVALVQYSMPGGTPRLDRQGEPIRIMLGSGSMEHAEPRLGLLGQLEKAMHAVRRRAWGVAP